MEREDKKGGGGGAGAGAGAGAGGQRRDREVVDRLQKPRQPRSHHRRRSRSHVRRHQPRALVHRPVRALWAGTRLRNAAVSAAWLPLAPCPTHLLSALNRTTGSI